MEKRKYKIDIRTLHIIGGVVIGLAFILDVLQKMHLINGLLYVGNEYIYYLFSLIFTVATLGSTLLSIIVSVSNNKILGLQLREIVSLTNSPLKIERIIIEALIVVAVSICALAIGFCNTMTGLAGFLICFLIYHSFILCRIVFNKQYSKDIVYSSISAATSIKADYVHSWIMQLLGAIENSDISSEEEYLELIKKAIAPEEPKQEQPAQNTSEESAAEEPKQEKNAKDASEESAAEELKQKNLAKDTSEEAAAEEPKQEKNAEDASSEPAAEELKQKNLAKDTSEEAAAEEPEQEKNAEDASEEATEKGIESKKATGKTSKKSAKKIPKDTSNEVKREFFDLVAKRIPSVFSKSCMYQSYVDSYKRILRLNDPSCKYFDEWSITSNYIMSFKYAEPKELANLNIAGTIEDIIMCNFLSEDEKELNCYRLFDVLLSNRSINETDRLEAVYAGFCALLWLDDDYGYSEVRVKTAIRVFRNKVLLAKDFTQGKKVYAYMLKAAYTRNQYRSSKCYASFLSQIVRMIYFWAFLEAETLSEQRRRWIATVPDSVVETTDNATLSISFLIGQHHNRMVEFLIEDAFGGTLSDPLDYWPDILNGKSVVCTNENKIKFALWFYSIWGYGISIFPIEQYISFDAEEKLVLYKSICVAACEEFTSTGKELTIHAKENVSKLQRLYKKPTQMPETQLTMSFDAINKQIMQINILQFGVEHDPSKNSIYDKLIEELQRHSDIVLDESLSLKDADVFEIFPFLCLKNDAYDSIIVYGIKSYLENIVNEHIRKSLPEVQLCFNKEGVVTLKEALSSGGYHYCNYLFYNDWGIEQSARASQEYSELKTLVDSIPYRHTYVIRENIFLRTDNISCNCSIDDLRAEDLKEEQLESYLSQYKVADEQYNIDGGVYHKTAAIEYFGKTRFLLHVKIKIVTNICKDSGFQITFKEYK